MARNRIYIQLPPRTRSYPDKQPMPSRGTCCICGGCLDLRAPTFRYISGQFSHRSCCEKQALLEQRKAQLTYFDEE